MCWDRLEDQRLLLGSHGQNSGVLSTAFADVTRSTLEWDRQVETADKAWAFQGTLDYLWDIVWARPPKHRQPISLKLICHTSSPLLHLSSFRAHESHNPTSALVPKIPTRRHLLRTPSPQMPTRQLLKQHRRRPLLSHSLLPAPEPGRKQGDARHQKEQSPEDVG